MRGVTVPRRRVREEISSDDVRMWSFSCSGALYVEFESRAVSLGCSVDWLLAEAMQRLLAETRPSTFPPAPEAQETESRVSAVVAARKPSCDDTADDLRATEEWASVLPSPPPAPSQSPSPPAEITLSVGGQRVRVDREPFVIGRRADEGIALVIDKEGVSRRHAMLERGENGWLIFDLGSTNGTLVNDNYVAGAPLRTGDLISLGPVFVAVE